VGLDHAAGHLARDLQETARHEDLCAHRVSTAVLTRQVVEQAPDATRDEDRATGSCK
jgi:hypothetical protein